MSDVFEFVAEKRSKSGKSAARAIRREGKVPAVIYGGGQAAEVLALNHTEVLKHLEHEAVFSHILDINIDGQVSKGVLKDLQRHPAKRRIIHLDFMRVQVGETIRMHVPLHFIGAETAVGVKAGGIMMTNVTDVEVDCLPVDLPEYIEVDVSGLDVGESLHLGELAVPNGVQLVEMGHEEGADLAVVTITAPTVSAATPEEEEIEEGEEGED